LREAIERGQLKPGNQLSTIVEIAAKYQITAGTAYRAPSWPSE
jgi:DNA-binding GntR family transcriptional regulator